MNDMTYKNLVQVYSQPNAKGSSKIGLLWHLLFGPLGEPTHQVEVCECGRYFCNKTDH